MSDKDLDIDLLPVRLMFQAGQIELPVGELDRLAPGMIVPLERTVEDGVDIIANGRLIGRGGLVKVGDRLAVRVTRLNSNA